MPLSPYKLHPVAPTVCLLQGNGHVLSEHGELIELDKLPKGYRVWCDFDTVRDRLGAIEGEALCWNNEEIRWRHKHFEQEWRARHSDVAVLKLPFFEDDPQRTLKALAAWRDWLSGYRAAPLSTTGAASWSLLRSRLERPLWLSSGALPPINWTIGGRQQLGPAGPSRFEGRIAQVDIQAAYALELAHLPYGGRWYLGSTLPGNHDPDWWGVNGEPVFVRATVQIPADLPYGPLPVRPRSRPQALTMALFGAAFPVGKRLQGCWTLQELRCAEQAGCAIVKQHDFWVHLSGSERPFESWWDAVAEGRKMAGLAGLLAKTTGNALWGRFCMNRSLSKRTIRRPEKGRDGAEFKDRSFAFNGGLPPNHDLAETISGRVRARLYQLMLATSGGLLSAHTDGAWIYESALPQLPEGWRVKMRARRLDILGPQSLRYWPAHGGGPRSILSGVPARRADAAFEKMWDEHLAAT